MEKEKFYWITKDGTKLDIDEMDITHLRNIVKMIVSQNKNILKNVSKYKKTQKMSLPFNVKKITCDHNYLWANEENLWK